MDPRLVKYYNRELQHLRDMGGEFRRDFPKIAGRLGIEDAECADPYVERLLEGFAFLTARLQLQVDSEYGRFTQHLLETVVPHFAAPIPSMLVAQFQPDSGEGALAEGVRIEPGTTLRGVLGKGERTACEYRTGAPMTLWPIEVVEAVGLSRQAAREESSGGDVASGIRLRLRATAGLGFDKIAINDLEFFVRGGDSLAMQLHEQLVAHAIEVVVRPADGSAARGVSRQGKVVTPIGFSDDEGLLPYPDRSFSGYRLLQEYFAFPEKFLFLRVPGIGPLLRRSSESVVDIVFLFDRSDPEVERGVHGQQFALHCVPAINLVPKRLDRIHLTHRTNEYHVIPDRTRPMDFELHSITEATGYGTTANDMQPFRPFYGVDDRDGRNPATAFYTVRREPRRRSERQKREGPRSSYIGSEVFVSLVDGAALPYSSELRQLGILGLCTNRDLPLMMAIGVGKTDFTLTVGAPVESVRCVAGPTKPRPSPAFGAESWRLVNHLSANYLSLVNDDASGEAVALRELLSLYAASSDPHVAKQLEGVRGIASRSIVRRMPIDGPVAFARGLEVRLALDETHFEGTGIFLLGSVLEQFFARYVSINSFTETVVDSVNRGEVYRWPMRIGASPVI